jgi:hypothetical protein
MNKQKWIKTWLIFSLSGPLIIASINYLVDPYGLNHLLTINRINKNKKANTGYTYRFKTAIVRDKEFKTLLIGSSRIGVMDPNIVNRYLDGKSFNFSVPLSTTEIQHKVFLYTLKYNHIENLIYGIDFLSFNKSLILEKDFKSFNILKKEIEKKEKIFNYNIYFNLETAQSSLLVLFKNIFKYPLIEERYLVSNGMRAYTNHIHSLTEGTFDINKSVQNSLNQYFRPKIGFYKNYQFSKKYLQYFKKTITYCNEHNIKVWVYIPPMSGEHFNLLFTDGYFDEFETFKKEIVKVSDFIDFTGHNSITDNPNNYWDSSHLRVEFSSLVMKKIFHKEDKNSPLDFGKLVNKRNISNHLKNLRETLVNN